MSSGLAVDDAVDLLEGHVAVGQRQQGHADVLVLEPGWSFSCEECDGPVLALERWAPPTAPLWTPFPPPPHEMVIDPCGHGTAKYELRS